MALIGKRQRSQVAKIAADTIVRYALEDTQRAHLTMVLRRPGFVLHALAPLRSAALAIGAYEAASPEMARSNPSAGLRAGAYAEIIMAACYMFDHVADGQISAADNVSEPEELALAIAMLTCAQAEIGRTAITNGWSCAASKSIFVNFVSACAGQFMDAHLTKTNEYDLDKSFKMTSMKAGGLGRVVAELGAVACDADAEVIALCSDVGFHLFTFGQLVDDIRDSFHDAESPGDFVAGKKTVPLAFLLGNSTSSADLGSRAGNNGTEIRETFRSGGALVASQLLAESVLNRAKDRVGTLEDLGCNVSLLQRLTKSLEQSFRSTHIGYD